LRPPPKLALVHDWLDAPGGGEAVLAEFVHLFPRAPIFTLVDFLSDDERRRFSTSAIHTTPLQRMPLARSWFRYAAALAPRLMERLDTQGYDVIVSDSHAIAKGVRKRPGQLHLCYCHTPARFAWTMASTYVERMPATGWLPSRLAERAQARFRRWDTRASQTVDDFIANSQHIAATIQRCYGRASTVIYPPVDVERFASVGREARGDGYVSVSRLVPYKRIDILIDAFRSLPDRTLTIVGDGPERARLAARLPPNVSLAGRLDDAETARLLGDARGFVFAAHEDFGIATVEAQAAGTPVIAYGAGGSGEIVRNVGSAAPTGVLFEVQTPEALTAAVRRFESAAIDSGDCRANAARFSRARFRSRFMAHFDALLERSRRNRELADPSAWTRGCAAS
jgi:glycosyltransferase involved in cell wall biosynthesis